LEENFKKREKIGKKSEALKKISKRPPSSNSNFNTNNMNLLDYSSKNFIVTEYNMNVPNNKSNNIYHLIQKNKNKNYINIPKRLQNSNEVDKKIEKKISFLKTYNNNSSNINKNNNNYKDINDDRPQNRVINYENGDISITNQIRKLNINNPKIVKNSFDLSIPNLSTKSKNNNSYSNNNKFIRPRNSTPQNDGNNVIINNHYLNFELFMLFKLSII
jgi:hypothetical protein